MKENVMENCLHCEKGQAKYCEKCYQYLITENTKLQIDKNKLFEYKYYDEQNKKDRVITTGFDMYVAEDKIHDKIYDLIQAGYVEKVEEE